MKHMAKWAVVLLALFVAAAACQKDEFRNTKPEFSGREDIGFRQATKDLIDIVNELERLVDDLIARGLLNAPNGNGIKPKLRQIRALIERGEAEDAWSILNNDIIPQINNLHDDGALPDAEFDILIEATEGNSGTTADPRDEQIYRWKKMADGQKWMVENLNYLPETWPDPLARAWVYPGTNRAYGVLYNYKAMELACPEGWRMPGFADWHNLIELSGGFLIAFPYGLAQSTKQAYWNLMLGGESGFDAVAGGYRNTNSFFYNLEVNGFYWAAYEENSQSYWHYIFNGPPWELISRGQNDGYNNGGFSCRCIRD